MRARAFIAAAVALAFVVLPIAVHAPPSLASPTPKWTAGLKAALPADAATNPDPNLTSVSCASAGSCAAVGSYTDASGHSQGLLLSESSNVWSAGMKAPLPADAGNDPSVSVTSVSCVSAGSCTAVGAYQDSSGHSQGL